ncbi:hypothetical protein BO85DRAFT_222637 [Aspergillus piperis CBS 112811]|uniref:Uncharacterized protein n=1 Tax=Aspergillus piperis CBS 112811 TaxID=1448313 RepID=A0A8G1R697_9EURO|nr:hypothetical protein BO85DRAFT_222637 [Aspergillus piperis CBS 112811]RAH60279.1 hypothetical protein BO85DRAFT_222637 [Aspergillus piperis CBS 112811]
MKSQVYIRVSRVQRSMEDILWWQVYLGIVSCNGSWIQLAWLLRSASSAVLRQKTSQHAIRFRMSRYFPLLTILSNSYRTSSYKGQWRYQTYTDVSP